MREQIDTIPVSEAFDEGDECPFCILARKAEQSAIRYVIGPGASYMEPDVRGVTDEKGFCREHMKKLYDYGNMLGCALILQTHYAGVLEQFKKDAESFGQPPKKSLFGKKPTATDRWWQRLQEKEQSCCLCERNEYNMARYYHTFFAMLKELEFRKKVESSKGFCMRHFAKVMQTAEEALPNALQDWFYPTIFSLMEQNLTRVKEDLDRFVGMFDYRQAGADRKNSRDAVARTIQKIKGIYPADPPYKEKK